MLSHKTNFHHSKLPALGAIGYLISGNNRHGEALYFKGKRQRYIVDSFPLSDNTLPYSIGIHTAHFRNLGNNSIVRLSGFYFKEREEI